MTTQPIFHWEFKESNGSTIVDSVSGVKATLSNAIRLGHGRIGPAIKLDGKKKDSRIVFDNKVARFGTSDFTIAFGIKLLSTFKEKTLHIIGNRSTSGHGNFFSVRMNSKGQLKVEIDEDKNGKNYIFIDSKHSLADGKWHQITIVRQERTLKLYVDGVITDEAVSRTGIADIKTDAKLLLGTRGRKTPVAQYEDLRIYHSALSPRDVGALIPPVNRPLRESEIELIGADNSSVILTQDSDDLTKFAPGFKTLRVGENTRVTLFRDKGFRGTSQKCYANLPDIKLSKLKNFPRSVRIGSAIGEPFIGEWAVRAPNGQFLSVRNKGITTSTVVSTNELFKFRPDAQSKRDELVKKVTRKAGKPLGRIKKVFKKPRRTVKANRLFIDNSQLRDPEFSITNKQANQWLFLKDKNTFDWTEIKADRAIFVRSVRIAKDEGKVGELFAGEVAFYEHVAYHGKTWIFSDSTKDRSGSFANFVNIKGLNDKASSIRTGSETGVTLFKHVNFSVSEKNREKEVEDIIDDTPNLIGSQIGNDAISSIKIFKTVSANETFTSVTSKLSQDYRMNGGKMEEFSAYRTIFRFEPGAGAIQLSATDLTTVEIEGVTHTIDEQRSIKLRPNKLNFIMVTSEADGLNTPGLKIHTDKMSPNERVVIFPNRKVQQQIAEFEEGALWNAKDAKGNHIVDRNLHSKAEVASVQNTLRRMMATVDTAADVPVTSPTFEGKRATDSSAITLPVKVLDNTQQGSVSGLVSATAIESPWALNFNPSTKSSIQRSSVTSSRKSSPGGTRSFTRAASVVTEEVSLTQDAFTQLLRNSNQPAQSARLQQGGKPVSSVGPIGNFPIQSSLMLGFKIPNPFDAIKDVVEDATSVIVGVVDDVVHVLVDVGGKLIDFVVDTVEKVVEFVQAIAEKIVSSIKQFIEFLQFLFDWDDILATQRSLVKSINSAFDSAGVLVNSAKTQVSQFIGNMQEGLNDGTDNLITMLGVDPADVDKPSGVELPEAAEWFLNKVLGGSKSSGSKPVPDASSDNDAGNSSDSFQQALEHLLEGMKDVGGIGAELFDGVVGTVEALITNPQRPELALVQIIDTFRDVGIKILDLAENLILAFLDTVVGVIKLFQEFLNKEIRIPFISDLFEFVGAGKLTLLNLASVLLAIPVTVVSKLVFGNAPFNEVTQPEFPKQNILPAQRSALRSNLTANAADETESETDSRPEFNFENARRKIKGFGTLALISDTINGILITALDLPPEAADDNGEGTVFLEVTSLALRGFSWLASFPASKIEPGGYPYNIADSAHNVSKENDEREYWERVMWGWRTGVFGLDILMMMAGFKMDDTKKLPLQRMRRGNLATAGLVTALSAVDLGITGRYLHTKRGDDNRFIKISNEIVPMMPDLLCGTRFSADPATIAARFVLNAAATSVPFLFGMQVLTDDLIELSEKERQAEAIAQLNDQLLTGVA